MAVSYVDDISDGQGVGVFIKVLKRWRGSLYKLVLFDLAVYICLYYVLNLSYRFVMNEDQHKIFDGIVKFCEKAKSDIPISFLLGFFVSGILSRWFTTYIFIPWMNDIAMSVATTIHGRDVEKTKKIRLTIMRYLNLAWILMMRRISDPTNTRFLLNTKDECTQNSLRGTVRPKLKRNDATPWQVSTPEKGPRNHNRDHSHPTPRSFQFDADSEQGMSSQTPTAHSLPDAFETPDDHELCSALRSFNNDKKVIQTFGILITNNEIQAFSSIAADYFRRTRLKYIPEYWVPIQWAQRLTLKAFQTGFITEPKQAYNLIGRIGKVRASLQVLQIFSSMMIPLAYTQVVTIAVYSYFLCQLFATQFVEHGDTIDLYIPIFSIFQFLFLQGWYRVAICVMNPFGDDDEDFPTSDILDYNLEVSYRSVTLNHEAFPEFLSEFVSYPPHLSNETTKQEYQDLEEFLKEVNCNPTESVPKESKVSNLVRPATTIERVRNCFGCHW